MVSLIPFLIVLLPHLIWLTENDYITISYGLHRTGSGEQNFLDHIIHPLIFLGKQIGILIPFFLMLLLLSSKFKIKSNFKDNKLLFLLAINIIPIALVFLTSMIMGVKIRTMWMTPFYLFFGVLVIYIFQSQINLKKLKSFTTVFIILFIFSPFAYAYVSITQTDKRTDYQGKEIAEKIMLEWEQQLPDFDISKNGLEDAKKTANEVGGDILVGYWFTTIEGDEWEAGNLTYHLRNYDLSTESKYRLKWNSGQNLILCGVYFSTEGVKEISSLSGKRKKYCFKIK